LGMTAPEHKLVARTSENLTRALSKKCNLLVLLCGLIIA